MTYEIVPANTVPCADLMAVFGTRGGAAQCFCQRYKLAPKEAFARFPAQERADRLREQTQCGDPDAAGTTGLLAYEDGEPVGWCAFEPRPNYVGLTRVYKTPWDGRDEDRSDASVWAVTCVYVRPGHRNRRLSHALATAAVGFARERGARALEAYPMRTRPGKTVIWDELHVGTVSAFAAAGLAEVHQPSKRRVVMRIDL